jgi:Coenzyme PQQ synthesis protein D (PqqD)
MSTNIAIPHEHIVSTELEGGEGVLVDLNSKQYYQLNETAMLVWKGLEQGNSLDDILCQMKKNYRITQERAEASVERLLGDFGSYNLLQRHR